MGAGAGVVVRLSASVAFVAVIAGCGDGGRELSFTFPGGLSDGEIRSISGATRTLLVACPGIAKYWGDLKQNGDVGIGSANQSDERELGWKKAVRIELVVSGSPQEIPPAYRAAGHHCYYDVGIEQPYGVSMAKSPCIAICQDKPSREAQRFTAVSNPG